MSSLFGHLLLMLTMHSGEMYMPPSSSLLSITLGQNFLEYHKIQRPMIL